MDFILAAWLIIYAVNGLVIARALYLALKGMRIYTLFWGAMLAYHVLPILQFSDLAREFRPMTLFSGQVYMLLGNGLLLQLTLALEERCSLPIFNSSKTTFETTDALYTRYYVLMALTGAIAIGLRFLSSGLDALYTNWEDVRQQGSDISVTISQFLGFVFFAAPWVAVKQRKWIWVIVLLALDAVFFVISSSRAIVLTLGCAVVFDLLRSSFTLQKKIALLLVISMAVFAVHTFARIIRSIGVEQLLSPEAVTAAVSTDDGTDLSGGEADMYRSFNVVFESNRTEYPYRSGVTLIRLLLIYVPRVGIFSNKPGDITYQIWLDAIYDGYYDANTYIDKLREIADYGAPGSTHPTLWGDAYCNLGWLALALYPGLMAVAVTLGESRLASLTPLAASVLQPILGITYAFIARGNVVIAVGYIAYVFPVVIMLFLLMRLPVIIPTQKPARNKSLAWGHF